jgi:hypothetical protein
MLFLVGVRWFYESVRETVKASDWIDLGAGSCTPEHWFQRVRSKSCFVDLGIVRILAPRRWIVSLLMHTPHLCCIYGALVLDARICKTNAERKLVSE